MIFYVITHRIRSLMLIAYVNTPQPHPLFSSFPFYCSNSYRFANPSIPKWVWTVWICLDQHVVTPKSDMLALFYIAPVHIHKWNLDHQKIRPAQASLSSTSPGARPMLPGSPKTKSRMPRRILQRLRTALLRPLRDEFPSNKYINSTVWYQGGWNP